MTLKDFNLALSGNTGALTSQIEALKLISQALNEGKPLFIIDEKNKKYRVTDNGLVET